MSDVVLQEKPRFPRRTLVGATIVFVLHFVVAYLLDAFGLIEALLSPGGLTALLVLPFALLLYALRLALFFLVPGRVVGALIVWLLDRRATSPRPPR